MSVYLGNFAENATVYFLWSTNTAAGSSISRAQDGVIRVYKQDVATFTTAGITDLEDFDSVTGIHSVAIDMSEDSFYTADSDFEVVIVDLEVDGIKAINAVLAHFSVTNRS